MRNITVVCRIARASSCALACLALMASVRLASAQGYTATDLGSLSGDTGYSYVNAINASGQVAGYSGVSSGADHAYFSDAAHGMTDLGSLNGPGGSSYGNAINDSGQVAGTSDAPLPAYFRAFVWDSANGMQDLGVLVPGGLSQAYGINNSGQVVGMSTSAAGGYHAFVWDAAGGMQDIGSLLGAKGHSVAYAINNAGVVVGLSQSSAGPDHAFVWDAATGMHDLGSLEGDAGSSVALAINSSGQIVGQSQFGTSSFHATLWNPGEPPKDLGSIARDGASSTALAINDGGQVTGYGNIQGLLFFHAFVWNPVGGMVDMSSDGKVDGYSSGNGIDATGRIVGFWPLPSGRGNVDRATIMTPIPPDTSPPVTTATLSGPAGSAGWCTGAVQVTLLAADPDGPADIASTFYSVDGGSAMLYAGPFMVTADGAHTVVFWSTDQVGNSEKPQSVAVNVDSTAPTLAWDSPSPAPNAAGWNRTAVSVAYSAADSVSGVASSSPIGPLQFSAEGAGQTQNVTVMDNAGNSATFTSPAFNIDMTPPATSASLSGTQSNGMFTGPVTVNLSASDALSGVSATFYTVDGGAAIAYAGPITVSGVGTHSIAYWSVDKADNQEASHTLAIQIVRSCPTISVNARVTATNPSGQRVTIAICGSMTDPISSMDPASPRYQVVSADGSISVAGPITLAADGTYSACITISRGNPHQDQTLTITASGANMAGKSASAAIPLCLPHIK